MANKDLKSLKFPNLSDTYLIPEIDNTLTQTGKAADAKATGDELSALRTAIDPLGIKENFTIDIAGVAGPTSKTIYGNFKSGDEIRISCTLTKTGTGDYNCAVKNSSNTNIKVFYANGTDNITLAVDTSSLTFVLGKASTITALTAALNVQTKLYNRIDDAEDELDAQDARLDVIEAIDFENVTAESYIESGYWAFTNGTAGASGSYCRSVGYIPSDCLKIYNDPAQTTYICLLAFDGSNSDTFVGTWNHVTNTFDSISNLSANYGDYLYDIAAISALHPSYKYKLDFRKVTVSGDLSPSTVGGYTYFTFAAGKHEISVQKDGSGDYSNLVEAIRYATLFKDAKVYIGDGEWDVLEDLGSTYLSNVSQSQSGLVLKNRVHLIGSSRSVISADYDGSDTNVMTYFSIFNSGAYGFTLENITLHAEKVRYCVHDERGNTSDAYQNKYIRCNMYIDQSDNTAFTGIQCVGGGLGKAGDILIDGCQFESYGKWGGIVSWHNNGYANSRSSIFVKDSYFKGHGTFRFSWYGPSTEISTAMVCGCSLGGDLVHRAENESATTENTELIGWNNTVRT